MQAFKLFLKENDLFEWRRRLPVNTKYTWSLYTKDVGASEPVDRHLQIVTMAVK